MGHSRFCSTGSITARARRADNDIRSPGGAGWTRWINDAVHTTDSGFPGGGMQARGCRAAVSDTGSRWSRDTNGDNNLAKPHSRDARPLRGQVVQDSDIPADEHVLHVGGEGTEIGMDAAPLGAWQAADRFSSAFDKERTSHSEQSSDHVRQRA